MGVMLTMSMEKSCLIEKEGKEFFVCTFMEYDNFSEKLKKKFFEFGIKINRLSENNKYLRIRLPESDLELLEDIIKEICEG